MAKGTLTQKDLMIWVMDHPNGTKVYYLIEKAAYEADGFKKCVHRFGSTGDAVFNHLDQAEAALAEFPPGDEEPVAAATAGAEGAVASEATTGVAEESAPVEADAGQESEEA